MIRIGALLAASAMSLSALQASATTSDALDTTAEPGPPIALAPSTEPGEPERRALGGATPPTLRHEPSGHAARILEALETTAPLSADNAGEPIAASVRGFYAARGFAPIWTDERGPLPRARGLLDAVLTSTEDGLEPSDYISPRVQALFETRDPVQLAQLEASLTWAYVRLASDLASGRTVPNEVDPELFVHPHDINPAVVLAQASAVEDVNRLLERHAPQTEAYRKLKAALVQYRAIQRLGGWTKMSAGQILRPGYRGARVAELKKVLAERGEPVSTETDVYDAELIQAVKGFQRRHGLSPDGAFGPRTRAALNMSVEDRINQLVINMERRRWMPDDLGDRYAFVNLADFRLNVVFHGETVYDTRVVVGTDVDRTPVFSDRMTYLVINPYWNIPPSIAREEMLPQLREDPYSLAAKGIRVFSSWSADAQEIDPGLVDWFAISDTHFPFKLRQDPGGRNALGRVKFMFPNKFNIYLHDTPSKSLFRRTVRTFSHGCIRVEEPFRLAKLLLEDDPRWTSDRFDEALASYQRRIVTLPNALNVHLTYLTAWVDDDGHVQFRGDVYGRDRRLTVALDASRASTPMAANDGVRPLQSTRSSSSRR